MGMSEVRGKSKPEKDKKRGKHVEGEEDEQKRTENTGAGRRGKVERKGKERVREL